MYLHSSGEGERHGDGHFKVEQQSKRRKALGECVAIESLQPSLQLLGQLHTIERATDALLQEQQVLLGGYFGKRVSADTRRIFRLGVWSEGEAQKAQYGGAASAGFSVRLSGRVLQESEGQARDTRTLTEVAKRIVIQVGDADHVYEWNKHAHDPAQLAPSLEISQLGSEPVDVVIAIEWDHSPPMYRLSSALHAYLQGPEVDSHSSVCSRFFIQAKQLPTGPDGRTICDAALQELLGVESFMSRELVPLLRPHLSEVEPTRIQYRLDPKLSAEASLQVSDHSISVLRNQGPSSVMQLPDETAIKELDHKLEGVMEQVQRSAQRCKALKRAAEDPVAFLRDSLLQVGADDALLQITRGQPELQRKAGFYYNPVVVEAANVYIQKARVADKKKKSKK